MSRFPELNKNKFERFLKHFSRPGSLKFRNSKWLGLNRGGKPFTVYVKHGSSRKYSPTLVRAVAGDLEVTPEEFREWYDEL